MEYLIQAENVSKSFETSKALDKLSVAIPRGSIFGLLGPNGAGKTTFIRILNQITFPDSGRVLFNGQSLDNHHVKQIGYLPEERGLYKNMKVGEQALYLARLKGMNKEDARNQLKYWFNRLEISHWWNKKISELSKGMAQKIQFVVTVLHKPQLLIFDEPFSGFDPINANLIKDEILFLRDQGATVIFSTHRMESVEELCDHIALIDKSQKILDGKLIDIKRAHRSHTFQIALETEKKELVKQKLESKFNVSETQFKSLGDELKLTIQIGEKESANELLIYLNSLAVVTHFVELVPSVNDIFIETVRNNS